MLGVVGSNLTSFKLEPTTRNMLQHVATGWPNARNMLRPTMLGYVALNVAIVWPGLYISYALWRCVVLMVSAFIFESSGLGWSPGWGHWARHFTPAVPFSTEVFKWVPVNLMLGVTLPWTSIPSRGE